ncbi:MAG: hypothetical protein ACRD9S_15805 [Pyrinomonadaceae bacterium]
MKTELLKSVNVEKIWRSGVALLFCACLTLCVSATAAGQVKDKKHVTAIQLGGAAEGSRVTVVSDSPLIDYEAFRRGDRFYVKIPQADLSAAAPNFRADGFEDVQVQKVGDSQIVSFKLQPGASARVDQRGNRLDVVFSAANRIPNNNAQGLRPADRRADAAGRMPSDSTNSRARIVNEGQAAGDPSWQTYPKTNANKNSNPLTTENVATASASPLSSPSSILSPRTSTGYQPLVTATPTAPSKTSSSGSAGFLDWKNRTAAARQWVLANRIATLLGALILLSLFVYLVTAIRRRRQTVSKTKQAKTPKIQPRYSAGAELNELSNSGINEQMPREPLTRSSYGGALTRPTIVSPSADHDEQNREEEEREVFEL